MRRHDLERRTGIMVHGRELWVSELFGLCFVAIFSLILIGVSLFIIRNETTIYRQTSQIASGESNRILLTCLVDELHRRVAITELLCSIAGKKLAPELLIRLSDIVYRNSAQFGYDPLLLLAVIKVESLFETNARGRYLSGLSSGALGLMQVKPETADEIAQQLDMGTLAQGDLFKPEINVPIGVAYLTSMISRFKSFKLGLLAYNQGPAVVSRQLAQKTPLSVGYYRKVLQSYTSLTRRSKLLAAAAGKEPLCR